MYSLYTSLIHLARFPSRFFAPPSYLLAEIRASSMLAKPPSKILEETQHSDGRDSQSERRDRLTARVADCAGGVFRSVCRVRRDLQLRRVSAARGDRIRSEPRLDVRAVRDDDGAVTVRGAVYRRAGGFDARLQVAGVRGRDQCGARSWCGNEDAGRSPTRNVAA